VCCSSTSVGDPHHFIKMALEYTLLFNITSIKLGSHVKHIEMYNLAGRFLDVNV